MRKRRVTPIGAAFVALVLLVLLFVVRGALHHPAHVVLPQDASSGDVSDASLDDSAVGRIAVRPDTVQSAIATLERPARYSRAITIERYYSGGSGVDRSSVSVDGAWMRVDTEQASGALPPDCPICCDRFCAMFITCAMASGSESRVFSFSSHSLIVTPSRGFYFFALSLMRFIMAMPSGLFIRFESIVANSFVLPAAAFCAA